jgi:adenylate cyclase
VGNIGAADRMDYTALGASVNVASRLEGMNKYYGTRVLASRAVRERAKKAFLFRSVDVVVPKGSDEPLMVFELVAAMPQGERQDLAATRMELTRCVRWERAVTLYRTGQWDKALAEFKAVADMCPEDALAKIFVRRTERLLQNKPGKDWKSLTRYNTK